MSLDYNKQNIPLAKELRTNATKEENHLWYDFLSKHKVRFQRQKCIDNFIADFYCFRAKLVIEIDGGGHYDPETEKYDQYRTEVLKNYGLKVLRFCNTDIDKNFYGVCTVIDKEVKNCI